MGKVPSGNVTDKWLYLAYSKLAQRKLPTTCASALPYAPKPNHNESLN